MLIITRGFLVLSAISFIIRKSFCCLLLFSFLFSPAYGMSEDFEGPYATRTFAVTTYLGVSKYRTAMVSYPNFDALQGPGNGSYPRLLKVDDAQPNSTAMSIEIDPLNRSNHVIAVRSRLEGAAKCSRTELYEGPANSGLSNRIIIPQGTQNTYAFRFYVASAMPKCVRLAQLEARTNMPPHLQITSDCEESGKMELRRAVKKQDGTFLYGMIDAIPYKIRAWNTVVMHVKHDHTTSGVINFYVNGALRGILRGQNINYDGSSPYYRDPVLKHGPYGGHSPVTVYYDDVYAVRGWVQPYK
jgi:hypothetical protein